MSIAERNRNAFRFPVLCLAPLAFCLGAGASYAQTNPVYDVNTALDAHDANPGDGICATAEGACTLRAAIEQNNATPGPQGLWGLIRLPAGAYRLTLDELAVTTTVSILGDGPLTTRIDTTRDRAFRLKGSQLSHFTN